MKKYTRPELYVRFFNLEMIRTENVYTSALTTWHKTNQGAELTHAKIDALSVITEYIY